MAELASTIRSLAIELGFDRVGFAPAEPLDPDGHLDDWLGAERHGSMGYLARHAAIRTDPRRLLPTARSLVVVASRYPAVGTGESIAAYARLDDYHLRMTDALRRLLAEIQAIAPDCEGFVCVDTKPMLERAAAERAGLGWVGKNTMLMDVATGPWSMLGVLLLSIDLPPDAPAKDRCGSCTRCLDQCPTNAFVAPYVLDARRCLSYWTIEHRGPWPREFREKLGGRIFGCDDCLAVCPFPRTEDGTPSRLLPVAPELTALDPREVLRRCAESFNRHFKRFAIQRAGKAGLVRNAITALGNVGGPDDADAIAAWLDHPDRGVTLHAVWALGRIGGDRARAILALRRAATLDPEELAEIDTATIACGARDGDR